MKGLALVASVLLLLQLAIVVAALVIGLVVSAFVDVPWYIAAVVAYCAIQALIHVGEGLHAWRAVRCPDCRRKIKTSKPIKCEMCGGPAQLAGGKAANNRMEANAKAPPHA